MATQSYFSTPFTQVDTEAMTVLGELRNFNHPTYGWVQARYIYNAEGASSIVQGALVQRKASEVATANGIICVTAKTPRQKLLGVADHTIAAGRYGWVIAQGRCQVLGDGSLTANSVIMSNGTSGRASNATLTNADEVASAFGVVLEDDGAAGSLADANVQML